MNFACGWRKIITARRSCWWVFYKKESGKPSITYREAVDEALCYGWIDAVRKSLGAASYTIRFCPRNKNSIWSRVNLERIADLKKSGRMQPAGLQIFESRNPEKTNKYSFEQEEHRLAPAYEKKFRARNKAWKFFQSKPPSYRKPAIHWVMSAKREETRWRRLEVLINDSEGERNIPILRRKTP